MKRILVIAAAAMVLIPGVALASHGKAGLWNISTVLSMPDMPQIPPEAMAMMKARGMSIPGMGGPVMTQICMTQAEVDADAPPPTRSRDESCQTHVTSKTSSSMEADTVCSGRMQGSGHIQVSYSGAEHYSGSYNFKGVVEGHASTIASTFKADWVKADCGAVKPFVPSK